MIYEEILIPIAMFAMIFGIVYVSITSRNRERMAMIEKGIDPAIFKSQNPEHRSLRIGMLLVGVSVGLVIGYMLNTYAGVKEELAYFSMAFLFGGLSLILYYFFTRKEGN